MVVPDTLVNLATAITHDDSTHGNELPFKRLSERALEFPPPFPPPIVSNPLLSEEGISDPPRQWPGTRTIRTGERVLSIQQ
jgi:hypothetical protein